MKLSTNLNSFLQCDWPLFELISPREIPLFSFENRYTSAGILVWHILDDRIFMSEGFYNMIGLSKEGLLRLEIQFWLDPFCEMRRYLQNILNQVCSSDISDTSFKTTIPGVSKEISGCVQLFDRKDLNILDLMLICWENPSLP